MNLTPISAATSTQALSVLCAFVLRATAGYAICALVARVATSATARFVVWLSFLFSATAYWLYSLGHLAWAVSGSTVQGASIGTITPSSPVILSVTSARGTGLVLDIAGVLYLTLLLTVTLSGIWKRIQVIRVLRFRTPAPLFVIEAFERICAEVPGPLCTVWLLPGLPSPASLGLVSPGIYLPADEAGNSTDLRDLLCHEFAHVRRRDALWEFVASLCRWLLCFHPLAHKALFSMRLEREFACDAIVVRQNPAERAGYAETLVRFGWKTVVADMPDHVGIGFTSQAAVLNARVKSILKGERVHSKGSRALRAVVSSAACWLFVVIAPVLWIGFRLQTAPVASAIAVQPASRTRLRIHRKRVPRPIQAAHIPSFADTLVSVSAPVPPVPYQEERGPRYHIQNADEPMSNPVVIDNSSSTPDSESTAGRKRTGHVALPSTTSILVDSASQLENMGIGRGHDHDHD